MTISQWIHQFEQYKQFKNLSEKLCTNCLTNMHLMCQDRFSSASIVSAFRYFLFAAEGTGTESDWDFCSRSSPCSEGLGDCDDDIDCDQGLVCGKDNCVNFWDQADSGADCCIQG